MASAAQSRNFLGFGKRKPAPRKKSVAKRSAFGWLTKKKETYHRDVAKERSQLRSAAIEDRRTRVELKKLKAQERAADAAIAQAERRIAAAAKQIDSAKAKQSKGSMSEDRFEAMKARMEGEIEKQKQHKAAILAKNPGCASTLKVKVSDRAKRYRANQPGCKPAGVKKCALCRSKRFLTVDHKDGDESNGRRSNLRWLCKSCNTILGAEMARRGIGRRTEQYNPGAETAAQYARAVAIHESHYVPGVGRIGEHDEGGAIIHDTPKSKRREFASAIWASRKAHRNPSALSTLSTDSEEYSQAKQIAELFHGRPVKEEITLTEQIREHDWLWRIGPLVKLKIRTLTKRSATLPFHQTEEGMVHLFCSPDGKQLYLRGGDQELDLKALDMGEGTEWYRDHMLIGEAKEITYRDKKKFHKFKLVDYFHKLGEVTKKKPMLAYNALAKRLEILGGQYKVETDELVDGMSPGIVN